MTLALELSGPCPHIPASDGLFKQDSPALSKRCWDEPSKTIYTYAVEEGCDEEEGDEEIQHVQGAHVSAAATKAAPQREVVDLTD